MDGADDVAAEGGQGAEILDQELGHVGVETRGRFVKQQKTALTEKLAIKSCELEIGNPGLTPNFSKLKKDICMIA